MQAAIGYLRVSTREQGRSGLGLAAQRHEIEAFGVREGLSINSLHRDSRRETAALRSWRCYLSGERAGSHLPTLPASTP